MYGHTYIVIELLYVKVKLSLYRTGQVLRAAGGWGSQNFQVENLSAPSAFTPQEITLVLTSVINWFDPRDIVRPEGLIQWKILVIPSVIESTPSQLVARCLSQLLHSVHRQRQKADKMCGKMNIFNEKIDFLRSTNCKLWCQIKENSANDCDTVFKFIIPVKGRSFW